MAKTGVILVNLGSPKSPKVADVRRFLREFLGDPRVVNLPRPLWWLILNLLILPFRPRKSAHAYQSIWTDAGSPLAVFSHSLCAALNKDYAAADLVFACAMRYGAPSLSATLNQLQQQGCEKYIIFPLYPQYSSTTTASIFDVLAQHYLAARYIPNVQFISDYHAHPAYIAALAEAVKHHWASFGQAELLLMSFHGLPEVLSKLGDPYAQQCAASAQALADALGLKPEQWRLVFQSRFGRAEWLKPYCVDTLQALPEQGIKKIDVICPGFAVDCLETLEEIAITNRQIFIDAGGEQYHYIPALNDSPAHAAALYEMIKKYV